MVNIEAIRENIHKRINKLRRLERVISPDDFFKLFEGLEQWEKERIFILLVDEDIDSLEKFLAEKKKGSLLLEEFSVRELRNMARDLGICEWYNLNRVELLIKIKKKKEEKDGR